MVGEDEEDDNKRVGRQLETRDVEEHKGRVNTMILMIHPSFKKMMRMIGLIQ